MARSAWPRRCLDDRRHRANSSRHSIAPYSRGGCGQGCVIRAASLNTAERHRGRASIEAVRVQGWSRRVVQTLLLTFWKHVRYQSVADVVRKRPQDVSCLDVTAGNQGEFLETDHRVAPPIGKPVITAITVPTSSPVACARAASATRVLGVMMN